MLSEFNNYFWPVLVASITILGIVGCYILLKLTGKKNNANDTNSTSGHIWDEDLEEKNNPLPRWWVGLFVITIIWGLIYLWLYPGIILTDGYLKWTQLKQYQRVWPVLYEPRHDRRGRRSLTEPARLNPHGPSHPAKVGYCHGLNYDR